MKRDVLRNFAKFTGKHLSQSLFFNEVAGLGAVILLKKRLWHNVSAKGEKNYNINPNKKNVFKQLQ